MVPQTGHAYRFPSWLAIKDLLDDAGAPPDELLLLHGLAVAGKIPVAALSHDEL